MHSPSASSITKLCLRLHPERDADLVAWLETLADLPFGNKGEAVKAALRRGIGPTAMPDPAARSELLTEMRAVVEAAVASALADAQVVLKPLVTAMPTSETDALLDALGEDLIL